MTEIILGPVSFAREGLVLDGVDLNDEVDYLLEAFDPGMPEPRVEWVEREHGSEPADDSERWENRKPTARIRICGSETKDEALAKINVLTSKFRKAARRRRQGLPPIEALWTPDSSNFQGRLQVIRGRIVSMPIEMSGENAGWFQELPLVEIELECEPFLLKTERLVATVTLDTPIGEIEVAEISGDAPALTRIKIDEGSGENRALVKWGREAEDYVEGAPLFIDSDDSLQVTGFAGVRTTRADAFDSGLGGNNVIRATLTGTPVVVCRTPDLSHIGRYIAGVRAWPSTDDVYLRAAYRNGSGPWQRGYWRSLALAEQWLERELGEIVAERAETGTQRFQWQIEAYADTVGATVDIDYGTMLPSSHGRGIIRAPDVDLATADAHAARDSFDQAAGALVGKTLPAGGVWTRITGSTDDGDDFEVNGSGEVERTAVSDADYATGRYDVAGATDYAAVLVKAVVSAEELLGSGSPQMGVFARLTSIGNWLRTRAAIYGKYISFTIEKRIGSGAIEAIDGASGLTQALVGQTGRPGLLSLAVAASGRYRASLKRADGVGEEISTDGFDADFGPGGITSGKVGIFDAYPFAAALTRTYDDFEVFALPQDAALFANQSIEIRSDATEREDSAGTYWGQPPVDRLSRPKLEPAGEDGVVNRIAFIIRRSDADDGLPVTSDALIDEVTVNVYATERFLEVPGA